MATWTVDVESDFGGRENSIKGIEYGIPRILEEFKRQDIKAIFFLSTKKLIHYLPIARQILGAGHTVGSHGHEHVNWKKRHWIDWWSDYKSSKMMIKEYLDVDIDFSLYRAPWFSHSNDHVFDDPRNHVSVLKYAWFGGSIPTYPIFYIHPFDIVEAPKKAPNLFCKLLYSNPRRVRETFHELVQEFS